MERSIQFLLLAVVALLAASCAKDNTKPQAQVVSSGVFNTPVGDTDPGPATPGKTFSFTFTANAGERLAFASMYGQSNDFFFGPGADGIALFDSSGKPRSGDVTSEVLLWDAGTELDEPLGTGPNQAPRQSAPNTGDPDPNTAVRQVTDTSVMPVTAMIKVTLTNDGGTSFTVTIEVKDNSPTPLSPGVYVVFRNSNPLFTEGQPDYGKGLEHIAEDGDPTTLAANLQ